MNSENPNTEVSATQSERHLASLCRTSFLRLWSYPNPYRSQTPGAQHSIGKELCDLLVVCGNDVLIFSDKYCDMPDSGDVMTDWTRWYRKAVMRSANQLLGAERWIRQHRERIYLDPECTTPLPITLPDPQDMRVHRLIVANGARERCQQYFEGGTGSLIIQSGHDVSAQPTTPFTAPLPYPDKGFIHVLDEYSLNVVLCELDTITDLMKYLYEKHAFFDSLSSLCVAGEEELLAHYLLGSDEKSDYHLTAPDGVDALYINEGFWADLTSRPEYYGKKRADQISYLWDRIIDDFTQHLFSGTLQAHTLSFQDLERALRAMAKERRLYRRMLSRALYGIVDQPLRGFFNSRRLRGGRDDLGYVFISMEADRKGRSEQEYRELRRTVITHYCTIFADECPELNEIIGIGTEQNVSRRYRSHDLVYFNPHCNRETLAAEAAELREKLGIGTPTKMFRVKDTDFPAKEGPTIKNVDNYNSKPKAKNARKYKTRKKKSR
jgi:hypothetical protein